MNNLPFPSNFMSISFTETWNNADKLVSPVSVIDLSISVFPSDHSTNSNPSSGIAEKVISDPSSYSPPSEETAPPSPAANTKL